MFMGSSCECLVGEIGFVYRGLAVNSYSAGIGSRQITWYTYLAAADKEKILVHE